MEQFKKLRNTGGFTLIEMLIAMAIFVTFTGILINSYGSIVRSQREANSYRVMYVEARKVFDTLTQEFRDSVVDYAAYPSGTLLGGLEDLQLVSKDDSVKTRIEYRPDEGKLAMSKSQRDPLTGAYSSFSEFLDLNSEGVLLKDFKFYVSPVVDPYDIDFVRYDANQFQPKLSVFAVFEKELSNGQSFEMDLQTTISSRVYNQIYE